MRIVSTNDLLLQGSADVAKLHDELQIQTDARVDETTKQRQQILTLELELEAQRKEITSVRDQGNAAREQLQKDESAAKGVLRAELSAAADQLTACQTDLSEAHSRLQNTNNDCERLQADLHESNDANQALR